MPELPEVEMRRRFMESQAVGRRILKVAVIDPTVTKRIGPAEITGSLKGQRITATRRHGKWLFTGLENGRWLVLHFGMTGRLAVHGVDETPPRFVRLALHLNDGHTLAFVDSRKFGGAGMTDDVDAFLATRHWGPDPTLPGFDLNAFREIFAGRSGNLKGILLNQRVIAGIGNLYADEMLYQAGLHPETRAADLEPATVKKLYEAMMTAFGASLAVETRYAELPENFLLRHRNRTCQCPRCGATLKVHRVAGRSTYYCPRHQRKRR